MKKYISAIIISVILLSLIGIVKAESISTPISKAKLTKEIILTRYQIKNDFFDGVTINEEISKRFAIIDKMPSIDKKKKLEELEERFKDIRNELDSKKWLNDKNKKYKNVIENLFYRTYLELYY